NLDIQAFLIEAKGALKKAPARLELEELLPKVTSSRPALLALVKASAHLEDSTLFAKVVAHVRDTDSQLMAVVGLLECGQNKKAISFCQKISEETNDPFAWACLGLLLEESDLFAAILNFEKAIELDPTFNYLTFNQRQAMRR